MISRAMALGIVGALVAVGAAFADDAVGFTLEITGVQVNRGQVYVRIYANERDYKGDVPCASYVLDSASESIVHSFDIAAGEYVISLFQDSNGNGKSDTNFLGMPREPVALSNHTRGIPGGFSKLKIPITAAANKLTMNLRQIKQ